MKIIQQAIRTLSKFRLYFTINLLGLILSLTCGMILLRYIHQEVTVDHYVKDLDRVFLTIRDYQNQSPILSSITKRNNDSNHVNIIDASVESSSTFTMINNMDIIVNDSYFKVNIIVADTIFPDILSYQAKTGSIKFRSPNDAILTDRQAKHFFGNNDPLGKTIVLDATGDILTVVGILKEPATKSSFNFDILISNDLKEQWGRTDISLIKLYPGIDVKEYNSKYSEFVPLEFWGTLCRLQLFPLKDIYTDSSIHIFDNYNQSGMIQQGDSKIIIILLSVLILMFVVGFFNYLNIYTVLSLNRAREFGVKKVYGASGKYVFGQIWAENLLLTIIALFIVWTVIELTGGLMESLFSIPMKSNVLFDVYISLFVLFFFPILVSLHPAIKYNYSPPIVSLRSVNIAGKSVVSRIVFLSLQYVVTFFILVSSLFFMKQLNYMLNMDLGYQTKNIVKFNILNENTMGYLTEEYRKKMDRSKSIIKVLQQKMDNSPLIERWTQGDFMHTLSPHMTMKKENGEFQKVAYTSLSGDYMDMFEFKLLEGRLWDSGQDEWAQYKMIINETAKKLFDIKDITREKLQPENRLWYSAEMEGMDKNPAYEIVGVIKDFKTNHLSKENVPLIIVYEYLNNNDSPLWVPFIVAINPKKKDEAIKFLRDTYDELVGEGNFEYTLLEDEISALYKEDKRVTTIFITFAIIAIFISCLGLYGLSLFDIRQRYREITLRKINGASVKDIIYLLLKKYTYILVISFLLAVPLSYFVIIRYLEGFANKTPVSWWLFAIAGLLVGAISYLTLYFQIKRAVRINPAEVLKSE